MSAAAARGEYILVAFVVSSSFVYYYNVHVEFEFLDDE